MNSTRYEDCRMLCRSFFAAALVGAIMVSVAPSLAGEAFRLPPRKAGCWEHTATEGLYGKATKDSSTYECVDAESEQTRMRRVETMACTGSKTRQDGGALVWDLICGQGSAAARTRIEVSGDFQSAYSTVIDDKSGAGGAAQKLKVVSGSKWVSASCPVGLKPGAILLFGGTPCTPDDATDAN
jgi:Protein of unknown function (DUF3617)